MNSNIVSAPAVASLQPVTHLNPQTQPTAARVLKLAPDVHLLQHAVAILPKKSLPSLAIRGSFRFRPLPSPPNSASRI